MFANRLAQLSVQVPWLFSPSRIPASERIAAPSLLFETEFTAATMRAVGTP